MIINSFRLIFTQSYAIHMNPLLALFTKYVAEIGVFSGMLQMQVFPPLARVRNNFLLESVIGCSHEVDFFFF